MLTLFSLHRFSLPSLRLPGPSARVSTAGGDVPPRGSVSAAGNRRSQGFSDKTKANSQLNKGKRRKETGNPAALRDVNAECGSTPLGAFV